MIQFCGYNLCYDKNTLDPMPTNLSSISKVQVSNGVFDFIDISKNTDYIITKEQPSWDYDTILDCDFNNNISGGNISYTLDQINYLLIKRRKKGEFDWITLDRIKVENVSDFSFTTEDRYGEKNVEYEYAIVPIIGEAEGDYLINSVVSDYNGVFIADKNQSFKLFANVSYSNNLNKNMTAVLNPLNTKYPIIVSNSANDYMSGTLTAQMLGYDFEETRRINRANIVEQTNNFISFLRSDTNKILKDWNGNMYLLGVNGDITVQDNLSSGVKTVSFNWVEQGDSNNEYDLYMGGLINI